MASAGQKYRGRRLGFWLFLAVLFHAELLLVIGVGLYLYAPRNADLMLLRGGAAEEQVEISTLDDDAARKILAELEREEEKAKDEETKKELESVQPPGQVVDLARPRDEKRPDQARFAAEHDSSVEKETRKFGRFDRNSRQGDAAGAAEESRPAAAPPGAPGRPMPAPGLPQLTPSSQQLARAIGSGTQDRLDDVEDGEETILNAKKWKFASFFNRVKAQVQEHWRPGEVYRRRDPTGAIYGNKDRYTMLHVQLKPDGTLANVLLETPSGVEFLD